MEEARAKHLKNWTDPTVGKSFYTAMAIACLIISIASFAPSLLSTSGRLGTFTWVTLIHGLLSTGWLIVFIVQTLWVRTGRLRLHRQLGTASLVLAAAMLVTGIMTAIAMGRRGYDLSGDLHVNVGPLGPVGQMMFPLLAIIEFGLLVTAGYLLRRRPAAHKRLMLFATIALLPAPFAHLIGHYPWLSEHAPIAITLLNVMIFASAGYDLIRFRRPHPLSLGLALTMFALNVLSLAFIGQSEAWRHFGRWLIQ